jgi:predicted acylesterase/phospholipase RssA
MELQSNEKKIGLALSSGAARGLAHIGVLAALEKEGIHVDMVAGSSMGAMVGALYAQGRDAAEMEKLARYWGAFLTGRPHLAENQPGTGTQDR